MIGPTLLTVCKANFILMDVIFLKRRDVSYKEPVSKST